MEKKIIVVDDESSIGKMIVQMLRRFGFQDVELFDIPTEAVDFLEKIFEEGQKPLLVITDVMMPNILGTEIANNVVSLWHDVPIVFMTGNDNGLGDMIAELGGRLNKPFYMADLKKALKEAGILQKQ